jgi:3-methyladenine DNA glycosylase AlkD
MMPDNWNKKTYKEFVDYLISIKEEKYKEFNSSICLNCKYEMLGIRLPILRKIAKDISKTNIEEFLKISNDKYYEEVMIQGLVISNIKEEEIFYNYFKAYIYKIDNWAICDSFCNSIKIVEKYEDKYFKESIELALNEEEFISRVGLIILLNHFIKEENLEKIFATLNKIESDKYYINMAEAWFVCEIYTKFPNQTLEFIKNNNLNKFTHNKSISKIHDSYRVSSKEKEYLNTLKRK